MLFNYDVPFRARKTDLQDIYAELHRCSLVGGPLRKSTVMALMMKLHHSCFASLNAGNPTSIHDSLARATEARKLFNLGSTGQSLRMVRKSDEHFSQLLWKTAQELFPVFRALAPKIVPPGPLPAEVVSLLKDTTAHFFKLSYGDDAIQECQTVIDECAEEMCSTVLTCVRENCLIHPRLFHHMVYSIISRRLDETHSVVAYNKFLRGEIDYTTSMPEFLRFLGSHYQVDHDSINALVESLGNGKSLPDGMKEIMQECMPPPPAAGTGSGFSLADKANRLLGPSGQPAGTPPPPGLCIPMPAPGPAVLTTAQEADDDAAAGGV